MFENYAGSTLDLSNFDTRNVSDMCKMFYGCSQLTTLDLSNFDTGNVTDMSDMFWKCKNLLKLDLSNFDTRNVTDMGGMFFDCRNITELDLSNFDTRNVKDMSDMFSKCVSLKLIILNPASLSLNSIENILSKCNIPLSVINSSNILRTKNETTVVVSPVDFNFIVSSPSILPLLSLVGIKTYDFSILSVVRSKVRDKSKSNSDFNSWYIKDVNGVTVVLTADSSVGFAIQQDGSIRTRGLDLKKEERLLIKKHLVNGIEGICNVIGKPLKIINIKKPSTEFTKAYLVESLEEQ